MKIKEYRKVRELLEEARDVIDFSRKFPTLHWCGDEEIEAKKPLPEEDLDILESIISTIFKTETLIDKAYLDDLPELEEEESIDV